jgi:mercuric ion binding protein
MAEAPASLWVIDPLEWCRRVFLRDLEMVKIERGARFDGHNRRFMARQTFYQKTVIVLAAQRWQGYHRLPHVLERVPAVDRIKIRWIIKSRVIAIRIKRRLRVRNSAHCGQQHEEYANALETSVWDVLHVMNKTRWYQPLGGRNVSAQSVGLVREGILSGGGLFSPIMKKIFATLIVLGVLALGVNSCADKSQAESKKATIALPTAKCETCKKTIETALQNVPGVQNSLVTVKGTKTVEVVYTPSETNEQKICQAISKAGYTANNVQRDDAAYQKLEDCCK